MMPQSELRREWFISNAVLTFMAALLLATQWGPTRGTYQLPGDVAPPNFPDPVLFGGAAFLFVLSPALAVVGMVPKLHDRVLPVVRSLVPALAFFSWMIFSFSWIALMGELPDGPWRVQVLAWDGAVMFVFLFVHFVVVLLGSHDTKVGNSPGPDAGA